MASLANPGIGSVVNFLRFQGWISDGGSVILLWSRCAPGQGYAAAEASLGLVDLVAAVASVGQFAMTCCTANAFEIDPPADAPIPLADI